MYEKIRSRKSVPELFEERLKTANVLSESEAAAARSEYNDNLSAALDGVASYKPTSEMLDGKWKDIAWPAAADAQPDPETGLPVERLVEIGKASVELPGDFVSRPRTG